jgi:uncharacterized protein YkwD
MKWLLVAAFVLLACEASVPKRQRKKENKQLLLQHNEYRALHGVGKLKWNAKVAKFAQNYCNYLAANDKFEHSEDNDYGENLYKSWGSGVDGSGKAAVKKWYDEIKDYKFDQPGFSSKTGHFTQVNIKFLVLIVVEIFVLSSNRRDIKLYYVAISS